MAHAQGRERTSDGQHAAREDTLAKGQEAGPHARHSRIPDGGEELFEFAMQLRARSSLRGKLTNLSPADLKRKLADRDV